MDVAPSTSLAARQPGSLVNLDDDAVGSPINQVWGSIFSQEVHSERFHWEEKGNGWACRILCPTQAKALGACLLALASQSKPVVWLTVENLANDEVAELATHIMRLPVLRALYLNGSFTRQGTDALIPALRRISTLQHLWLHGGHIEFLSGGGASSGSTTSRERERLGQQADQFLTTAIEENAIGSLEARWQELLAYPEIVGEQFCWKRTERNQAVSMECHIKGDNIQGPVFAALVTFLSRAGGSVSLGINSQACDDRMVEFLSRTISSFTGNLSLALAGCFADVGVDALISALRASPDKIRSLCTQGAYSWDKVQELTEVAQECRVSRISIDLPQIAFPKRRRGAVPPP
jgi:hypothetical protein